VWDRQMAGSVFHSRLFCGTLTEATEVVQNVNSVCHTGVTVCRRLLHCFLQDSGCAVIGPACSHDLVFGHFSVQGHPGPV
jgi:hypothetical protein